MEFTYGAYLGFLAELRARGYANPECAAPEALPDPSDPWVLLRHDVDVDLEPAATLAEHEAEAGWRSAYFVLTSSEHYNPASSRGRRLLTRIVDHGHQIGLHFDPTVHQIDGVDDFRRCVAAEVEHLEQLSGRRVAMVSFHRPAPELIGAGPELTEPLPHSYLPWFTEAVEYCSDSTGRWRFGPPEDRLAVAEGRALHLLTHPIWWGPSAAPPEVVLERWLASSAIAARRHLADELAVEPRSDQP